MRKLIFGFIFVICAFYNVSSAQVASEYHLNSQQSLVKFVSRAPLNVFEGKTKKITGWVKCDPKNLSWAQAHFSVDLASLDTDNNLRNKHMREKFLHTNKYPQMTFDLEQISKKNSLPADIDIPITAHGKIFLHGVTKNVEIPVTLHHSSNHELDIQSHFPLTLSDYDIETPSFLGMHAGKVIFIEIHLVLDSGQH